MKDATKFQTKKCDYWGKWSVRPPVGPARLPKKLGYRRVIGQIPLGPVPRNFLVANVTRKSPTSYGLVTRKSGVSDVSPTSHEEVTRKSATVRPSRHVEMVWLVANFLVTSRQKTPTSRPCRMCGIWRTTR